jgi:NTP pyrophosphatase (non-canonical NTP hydrolase)
MTLARRQKEVAEWRAKQFPDYSLLGQIAGATGELAGESLQSALKLFDGRVDGLDHETKIKDGIGDTLIYLMGACDILNTTLEECFELAWSDVQRRGRSSWGADKQADDTGASGHAVPQSELRDGFGGIA